MEINYQILREIRKKELDEIRLKYRKSKLIVPKKVDVKPVGCVIWQSGRVGILKSDEVEEENFQDGCENLGFGTLEDSKTDMAPKGEVDDVFEKAAQKAFKQNIIIGYLLRSQTEAQAGQEYIFHYSPKGIEMAHQIDEDNRANGNNSNSFFKSFLYKKVFPKEDGIYVSRGGMFPIFKGKLMSLKNRGEEIVEESSTTGRSVLELSTSEISNDLILISPKEKDINKYYKEVIKRYYTAILAKRGIRVAESINCNVERKRAEKELKSNIDEFDAK